ncbi:Flp family type IVb pilin [Sporolituus thermophilus]|uniref:Pilus assembly protein Flp/PilA n=1 Tax=Sporolituus thermophilus DSM 23256 TaxID=1123285 RepID=A0A1G7HNF5_9FIRM|nr:Flp family type IVb pilin [Sporolituus thermophilus]SDF01941.1 pilus assembly protein Flp/PilA [Sporolituus thermophilus DSM 23256]
MLMWWEMVKTYLRCQRGQGMVEYGLILALIAVVVIGALMTMGGNLDSMLNNVAGKLSGTTGQ